MTGRFLNLLGSLRPVRRSPGVRGEALAVGFLRKHRYKILARNLRNRFGEADILALAPDGKTIVLAEVKTAVGADPAHRPEMRVGARKRRRLAALAAQIARRHGLTDRAFRFDVIGVDLPDKAPAVIRHFPGAFESPV